MIWETLFDTGDRPKTTKDVDNDDNFYVDDDDYGFTDDRPTCDNRDTSKVWAGSTWEATGPAWSSSGTPASARNSPETVVPSVVWDANK